MKYPYHMLFGVVCICLLCAGNSWGNDVFHALLDEGGIEWQSPQGFSEVPIQANDQLPYEMALRSGDGGMEIRYAIRPLNRIEIDYDDPHGATPDPNHIFPLIFQALTGRLSKGGGNPSREYTQEDAKQRFGADWAAIAVFDVEPEFAAEYSGGLMLAMHRNRLADAYVIFLFKDFQDAKAKINENLATLVFRPNQDIKDTISQAAH